MISLINLFESAKNKDEYYIGGAVLGAFSKDKEQDRLFMKKYKLKVTENVPEWRGVVASYQPLSKKLVNEIHNEHKYDPDGKNVPYYFLVMNSFTHEIYVLYSGDSKWYPLNNQRERKYAMKVGLDKGLDKEHVDFVNDEASEKDFLMKE